MTQLADTLFVGGTVFTPGHPPAPGAVAVGGGRILGVATGRDADLADLRGPATEIVDLGGGMVMPGVIDAHVHPVQGGLERLRCDLGDADTLDDYLATVREYATANPDDAWIRGGGWQLSAFPGGTPRAEDLDRIVPDRPVFLPNRDHHGAWVNSRALELAGITRDTPDPADGRIERDANGKPTGTLHEGAAALVQRLLPADTDDDKTRALLVAQRYLHSFGITGWQDAIVGNYFGSGDTAEIYAAADRRGELTATVVGALWWDRERGLEQVEEFVATRERYSSGRFRATSIKIMLDGIVENGTAAMLDPYVGIAGRGLSFLAPDALAGAITALDARGFQVHVHAIGDRAVREALDAFETARGRNGSSANRHHLAHAQVVDARDVPRFAALDVTVNAQPLWASYEPQMRELNLPVLGAGRSRRQYPFGELLRAGARLCAGSDWPVTTPDPWAAAHVAVNRQAPRGTPDWDPEVFLPEQALTLAEVLTAYTAGSARINSLDDRGRIAPGLVADLAVTDRDPFAGLADEIADTRTVSTWVDGRRV